MNHLPSSHYLVRVEARKYEKNDVTPNGMIAWKETKRVEFEFYADKDVVPWEDDIALKSQIIRPAIALYNQKQEGVRYEYIKHRVLSQSPLDMQEFINESTKKYIHNKYFNIGITEQETLNKIKIQNETLNQILSHFKF